MGGKQFRAALVTYFGAANCANLGPVLRGRSPPKSMSKLNLFEAGPAQPQHKLDFNCSCDEVSRSVL